MDEELNQDDFSVRLGSKGISSNKVTSKLRAKVPTGADRPDGQMRTLKKRLSELIFLVFKVAQPQGPWSRDPGQTPGKLTVYERRM